MNADLRHMFEIVDDLIDDIAFTTNADMHEVRNRLGDIKDYLEGKDITDPQRKCTDMAHHFKGCDCW